MGNAVLITGGNSMQQLFSGVMTEKYAKEITHWKYEAPYDFYNLNSSTIKEFLENEYAYVFDKNQGLVGFFCIGEAAQVPAGHKFGAYPEGFVDVGLGMKPELTGKGNGSSFFSFILNQIPMNAHTSFRLTVAKFNQRAIRLYQKSGFVPAVEFKHNSTEFITMVKE